MTEPIPATGEGARADGLAGGAASHHRALERLYRSAPINALFESALEVVREGEARISFTVGPRFYHAAGAAHGLGATAGMWK